MKIDHLMHFQDVTTSLIEKQMGIKGILSKRKRFWRIACEKQGEVGVRCVKCIYHTIDKFWGIV